MATRKKNHPPASATPKASFRIYPRPRRSRLHFLVRIFDTHAEMTESAAPYRHLLPEGFRAANVTYYQRDGRNRLSPQRGELFFCLPHLDVGSVSHELVHSALAHARDTRINLAAIPGDQDSAPEETVAEMMDTLTSQFLTACQRQQVPVPVLPIGGN